MRQKDGGRRTFSDSGTDAVPGPIEATACDRDWPGEMPCSNEPFT